MRTRETDATVVALFRKYEKTIRYVLIRNGVAANDVDDLVQEVFIRALLVGTVNVKWLRGTARKLASNYRKAQRRRSEAIGLFAHECAPARFADAEARIDARRALRNMPEDDREALLKYVVGRMSLRELAADLKISKSGAWLVVQEATCLFGWHYNDSTRALGRR